MGRELHAQYPNALPDDLRNRGLGYAFEGYILDGAGLVTPEALGYHPLDIPRERDTGYVGAISHSFHTRCPTRNHREHAGVHQGLR